jgi:hypothetical protein
VADIREQVARAIREQHFRGMTDQGRFGDVADAALDAATPLIRAQVIDELAQKADDMFPFGAIHQDSTQIVSIADWLRAQGERSEPEPDDRKIYIGFKQKDKARD